MLGTPLLGTPLLGTLLLGTPLQCSCTALDKVRHSFQVGKVHDKARGKALDKTHVRSMV